MVRLGLVRDSRGRGDTLKAAAGGMEGCEGLCHLGDLVPDGQRMSQMLGLPLYGVRGNCDGWENAPEEMVLNVAGHKLLLCHGHRYGVKESLTRLYLRGQEAGADIVLYGHTHQPRVDRNGPMMLINPGALMNGRWAVLEFREMGPVPVMKIL